MMSHSSGLGLLVQNMWPLCLDSSSTLSKPVTYNYTENNRLHWECGNPLCGSEHDLISVSWKSLLHQVKVQYLSHSATHVLEEDAELRIGLWIDGGLEHRQENVLQHFAKVWHEVSASEDVAEMEHGQTSFLKFEFW